MTENANIQQLTPAESALYNVLVQTLKKHRDNQVITERPVPNSNETIRVLTQLIMVFSARVGLTPVPFKNYMDHVSILYEKQHPVWVERLRDLSAEPPIGRPE